VDLIFEAYSSKVVIGLSSVFPAVYLKKFRKWVPVVALIEGLTRLMSGVHFPKAFVVSNDKIAYPKLVIKQQISL